MATIELHLTNEQTLNQSGDVGTLTEVRDHIAQVMQAGGAVSLNEPDRVIVVNSAHVLYAVVTP
jgi:hypothetical protein